MSKNNKQIRYFGEITKLPNGRFKIKFVQKLTAINQFRRKWKDVDVTKFAKELNAKLILD